MLNSNMDNEEAFRVFGTLPPERIEELLDLQTVANRASDADTHVYEALIQFPDEDFLSDIIRQVEELSVGMRGKNREGMKELAIKLQDIELSTSRATEYGQSELTKARALLP